jgi:hypothetical protein
MKKTNAIIQQSDLNKRAEPIWGRRSWILQKPILGLYMIASLALILPVQADWCDESGCYGCLAPGCAAMVAMFESLSIEPAYTLPDYNKKILARDTRSRQFGNAFALADFNKDGRPDLAAHISSTDPGDPGFAVEAPAVRTYLQNASGEFEEKAEQLIPAFGLTWFFQTGDFNEDGHLDLLMDDNASDLILMLGKGDGTFQEATALGLGVSGFFQAADLNGDNHLDLAAGNLDGSGTVVVCLGAGNGTFTPKATLDTYVIPYFPPRGEIMTGDFNADGKMDIVVASPPSVDGDVGNLDLFFGNGDGTFKEVIRTENVAVRRGALGDFNGDGIPDFAGDRSSPMQVEIWFGRSDGRFAKSKAYSLNFTKACWGVKVADVNHDGIVDVLVSGEPPLPVNMFLGNGDGTFQNRQLLSTVAPYQPINAAQEVVDLNGDGFQDMVGLAGNSATREEILAAAISKGGKRDASGGLLLTVTAPKPRMFILETTSNFVDWTPVLTNSTFPVRFNDTSKGSTHRFYRARH